MWYALFDQQRRSALSLIALRAQFDAGIRPPWLPVAAGDCYRDLLGPLIGPFAPAGPWAIHSATIDGRAVPVAERTAAGTPFCRLLHLSTVPPASAARADRAIMLCAPLAGHAAVIMRETVETLLEDGDVYLTDWIDARNVPIAAGCFGLDEYVQMLDAFIEAIMCESRPLHVIAVCQPTNPVLAALALRASRNRALPRSLTLMGGR